MLLALVALLSVPCSAQDKDPVAVDLSRYDATCGVKIERKERARVWREPCDELVARAGSLWPREDPHAIRAQQRARTKIGADRDDVAPHAPRIRKAHLRRRRLDRPAQNGGTFHVGLIKLVSM